MTVTRTADTAVSFVGLKVCAVIVLLLAIAAGVVVSLLTPTSVAPMEIAVRRVYDEGKCEKLKVCISEDDWPFLRTLILCKMPGSDLWGGILVTQDSDLYAESQVTGVFINVLSRRDWLVYYIQPGHYWCLPSGCPGERIVLDDIDGELQRYYEQFQ